MADGKVWDDAADAWASCPRTGSPLRQPSEVVERWRPMPRLLRTALWTCSRVGVALDLHWSRSPHAPYLDLSRKILHRRRYREPETSKRRPSIPIAPKLLASMTEWAEEDRGLGRTHVVSTDASRRLGDSTYWRLMAELVAAAGLAEDVTMHVVRHSGAVWMLESGLSPEEVAEYMGVTVAVLLKWYDHYHWSFSLSAAAALDAAGS